MRDVLYSKLDENDRAMLDAAVSGERLYFPPDFVYHAAGNGHISLLEWADRPLVSDDLLLACKNGRLDVLEWARKRGYFTTTCHSATAAHFGQLNLLPFLWDWEDRGKHMVRSVLVYREISWPLYGRTDLDAAAGGQWCVFEEYVGVRRERDTCEIAAKHGQLEVLQKLRESGADWDEQVCIRAAEQDHFHVFKWAIENGAPHSRCAKPMYHEIITRTSDYKKWMSIIPFVTWYIFCMRAAVLGRKDVLEWTREIGVFDNNFVCACAAHNGHVELLQWLHELGCPWEGRELFWHSSVGGYINCMEWVVAHGYTPDHQELTDRSRRATRDGKSEVVTWIKDYMRAHDLE